METANGITPELSVFCKATQSPELVACYLTTETAFFCQVAKKKKQT